MSLRYIMYLRKSSESEERQELSIQAQDRELTEVSTKRQFKVVYKFEESRSAKEPGRPDFNQMMALLLSGKADGILVWKLDRLARNPLDGGQLMYALGKKQIKAIVTPERMYTGTADDKMLMSINFGMATKYSDDLSDNVKRGNREALKSGRWPGKPKLGYKRDPVTKQLVPDVERFQVLHELWRKLLSGTRPLELLSLARDTYHLTTANWGKCGGKLFSKSHLYRLFRDPFYAGLMVRGGETYSGAHLPMVSMAEFENAQAILDGKVRPLSKPKHLSFTYRGLIRCGTCQVTVTAKYTVNRYGKRYIHYYCCRKEKRYRYCPEGAVQEGELERQLQAELKNLLPPPMWTAKLIKYLGRWEDAQETTCLRARMEQQKRLTILDGQLERLRELLLKNVVSEDDYQKDQRRLMGERQDLLQRLGSATPPQLVEPHEQAISLLSNADSLFKNGTAEEKRELVEKLTWNLTLTKKKVSLVAKKPFSYLGEWSRCPSKSG